MSLLSPFRALRPLPERASDVAELPYDVMSRSEAQAMATGRPSSFLHVSRPDIDLADDVPPDSPEGLDLAAAAFARLRQDGVLVRDPAPSLYAYRLSVDDHRQTGVVGVAEVAAYHDGRIRRHELTTPAKQADRAAHMEAIGAQTGPVFAVHRPSATIREVLVDVTRASAETSVEGPGGVRHEALQPPVPDAAGHDHCAVARGGPACVLGRVRHGGGDPGGARRDRAYLAGQWYRLRVLPPDGVDAVDPTILPNSADPASRLDAAVLQSRLLGPIVGVDNPRTAPNVGFVGGTRPLSEVVAAVDSGKWTAAAFLHATTVDDLMAVADADSVMPPKSTWFEPKLLDGLVSHVLD